MKQARDDTTVVKTADEDVCRTVICAVAEARNVRPMDLDTPLYEAIDSEALGRIFPCDDESSGVDARLEFSWAGCDVTVHGRRVVVTRAANR